MKNWFIHFVYLTLIAILIMLFIGQNWAAEKKVKTYYKTLYENLYQSKKAELVQVVIDLHREA